jgi:ABC-type transport system involved in cytochrome bd biosynthesis fused ATPase/permease subunit
MTDAASNGSAALVTGEPAIELIGVTKRYGEKTVVDHAELAIERGEFLVLLGPSGCGKSTILKIISGLEDATGGDVRIDGQLVNYVAPKARNVAMVFQNYALYPHMTVAQNIGFPLKMRGQPKAEVAARVAEIAALLDLADHTAKYPEQLSGGQRQRSGRLPDGRAAVEPRRAAARADARGADATPCPGRPHDGLRDSRPGRGDDDGDTHRGAARRRDPAGRHPRGGVRPAR